MKYKFRELESKNELFNFLKLRYNEYISSSKSNFLKPNEHCIDLEAFDIHATHYGIFSEQKPIGYLRFVFHKNECYNHKIFEIGRSYELFTKDINDKINYFEFPFISYSSIPTYVTEYYKDCIYKKIKLVEPSRLIVFNDNKSIKITNFLMECSLAYYHAYYKNNNRTVVVNCDVSHKKYYSRYGFKDVFNNEGYTIKERKVKKSCLMSLSNSHYKENPLIEKMANELKNNGAITREIVTRK